jgi:hypothetical protein
MSNISIPTAARIIRAANPDISQAVAMTWAWQAYREAEAQQEERAAAAMAEFFMTRRAAVRGERYLARLRSAKLLTGKETGTGRATGLFPEGVACAYFPAREEAA